MRALPNVQFFFGFKSWTFKATVFVDKLCIPAIFTLTSILDSNFPLDSVDWLSLIYLRSVIERGEFAFHLGRLNKITIYLHQGTNFYQRKL